MDDRRETPEAANNFLKAMRQLLAYGGKIDAVPHNVAAGVEPMKSKSRGHIP